MPTILRVPGYRVVIYPNDHRPAHIHVESPQGSCVFNLNCPEGPFELRALYALAERQVMRLGQLLENDIFLLCRAWGKIHGQH